ncbi:coiled-coil domain-containing protein 25 isoform X1 [Asparagus officinalis]|uniref:coiled-coil domain-containing protein 25 isoform X1 n=1 Tax=Asparagus officinalis TaxID=4686 RepID=UPI00098E3CD9|nr:coiled-coil domain-containing protein 25 isoform X1 [Asparagus officinalis]
MVFYFKARPEAGDYTIFMGLDKFENEELIKYGFPEDIWFHVDKMSSAHVYLRLNKGQTIDDISEGVLEDCAQLVKANSIQGNKVNNIEVVYTPWYNLKKTASMDVGQVGFHNSKMVRTVKVEKRLNEVINRLNKTKVERKPDLKACLSFTAEREAVNAAERAERKQQLRDKKRREEMERLEREKQAEIRSYKGLMVSDKMTSNKQIASANKSLQELEEDFM